MAEIASGSVIIPVYVSQIPSKGYILAQRAYNQNFKIQPILENLYDEDCYINSKGTNSFFRLYKKAR